MTTHSVADIAPTEQCSQQVFDVLLRTLAEPGRIRPLPAAATQVLLPVPLWLPLALGDVDVPWWIEAEEPWGSLVSRASRAPLVSIDRAWIIIFDTPSSITAPRLGSINRGDALHPEHGARIAAAVGAVVDLAAPEASGDDQLPTIEPGNPQHWITVRLSGPGVPGTRTVRIAGLGIDQTHAAAIIGHTGQESGPYPAGLDWWFMAPNGDALAISRSTTVEIVSAEEVESWGM